MRDDEKQLTDGRRRGRAPVVLDVHHSRVQLRQTEGKEAREGAREGSDARGETARSSKFRATGQGRGAVQQQCDQ